MQHNFSEMSSLQVGGLQDMIPPLKYLQNIRGFMERCLGKHLSSIVVEDVLIQPPDMPEGATVSVIRFFPQFCCNMNSYGVRGVKHLDLFIHPMEKFPAFCIKEESGVSWGRFDPSDNLEKYVPIFMQISYNGLDPKSQLKTILHFSYSLQ